MSVKSEVRYQKRVSVVKAIQSGEPVALVARIFQVPVATIYSWLSMYRAGGYHNLKDNKRSGRPSKVTPEMLKWLYEAITMGDPRQYKFEFCLWTRRIIRSLLKENYNIDLSLPSISRLLAQLGLSVQKPIFKAYQQNKKSVDEWITGIFPNIKEKAKEEGAEIYFADESSFRSDHHYGGTWGKIGETPVIEEHRGRFGVNCISAVTARGAMYFKCFNGRMNSEGFICFLNELQNDAGKTIYVVADGAQYHKSKAVKEFIEASKGTIRLYILPSYSPELNPDEQVWNNAKRKTGSMCIKSKEQMLEVVTDVLSSIRNSVDLIKSFFYLKTTRYIIS